MHHSYSLSYQPSPLLHLNNNLPQPLPTPLLPRNQLYKRLWNTLQPLVLDLRELELARGDGGRDLGVEFGGVLGLKVADDEAADSVRGGEG